MRTLVDIPAEEIARLDALASAKNFSRAELIRQAVRELLARRSCVLPLDEAFGLWGPGEDGVELQRRLRGEWPE